MNQRTGARIVKRFAWTLWGRVALANVMMVGTLVVYFSLMTPAFDPHADTIGMIKRTLPPGFLFLCSALVIGLVIVRREWFGISGWMTEDREPQRHEREAIYAFPRRLPSYAVVMWVAGAAWIFPYFYYVIRFRPGLGPYLKTAAAWVLLAFVGWALAYLLVERALRPVVAAATPPDTEQAPPTMSLVTRLILAWAATTGVPIASIPIVLARLDGPSTVRARTGLVVICVVGGIAGVVIAAFSGFAIADPIRKVRAGMRAIERGDLDAVIPVSETADLGDLELGFNRMAAGLRERERLRALFGAHVGADVATRALEGEHGLGGERRQATAMFVDIIASTGLAQRQIRTRSSLCSMRSSTRSSSCVGAEGGLVNKFEGDGALCVFGAPIDQPDHATRALRAARRCATSSGRCRTVTRRSGSRPGRSSPATSARPTGTSTR